MTFQQFMTKMYDGSIHAMDERYGNQRLGQWFFSYLSAIRPDIAEELRGSLYDPFAKNYISDEVETFVRLRW